MDGGRAPNAPQPRDRSRRGQRKVDLGGPNGPHQIVDAAVACILEFGFYRASTNEIARRANVSWGSIQYHFGSRESLLLAVVDELNRRFAVSMDRASIDGDTLEERLQSLYGCLAQQYGNPTYLARMQILLNLRHDPDTSAEVARILAEQAATTAGDLRRLLREALGDRAAPATTNVVFHAIRGMALSQQLGDAIPYDPSRARPSAAAVRRERDLFVSALAAAARLDRAAGR